ncbi:TPA: retron Ec78 anti-phage system effector ATPase PtuA [Serratia fonticola]
MSKFLKSTSANNKLLKRLEYKVNRGDIRAAYQMYLNYHNGDYTDIDESVASGYLDFISHKVVNRKVFLENVSFHDFRGLSDLYIKCESELTVIVGNNGAGKTTILDGLAIILSWLKSNILKEDRQGNSIRDSDINNNSNAKYASIAATFSLANASFDVMISRAKEGVREKRNSELLGVKSLAGIYRSLGENDGGVNLPLVAYYPVSRSSEGAGIDLKKTASLNMKEWSKFDAYEDVFSDRHDFGEFLRWLVTIDNLSKQSDSKKLVLDINQLQNQIIGSEQALKAIELIESFDRHHLAPLLNDIEVKKNLLKLLKVRLRENEDDVAGKIIVYIKNAFKIFLPELENIRILHSTSNVKLMLTKNGLELDAQQLSQGEKSILTLIGDLTRRLVMLNPSLNNPLDGHGIVLIDEIDLHLHPTWQQRIVSNLRSVFKNIQFIITTHSPQVLSTVDSSAIRIITEYKGDDGKKDVILKLPPYQTKGVVSADILAQIMDTDPKPDVIEALWLDQYKEIIELGDLNSIEAKLLEDKLLKHFGKEHPLLIECEALKTVRKMKIKLAQKKNKEG